MMVIVARTQLFYRTCTELNSSVLIVPFGSAGAEGPTSLLLQPGETGY